MLKTILSVIGFLLFINVAYAQNLPDGRVGVPYSESIAYGNAGIRWDSVPLGMPPGMTLGGGIRQHYSYPQIAYGTPTTAGTYTFSVWYKSEGGQWYAPITYTIVVLGNVTAPVAPIPAVQNQGGLHRNSPMPGIITLPAFTDTNSPTKTLTYSLSGLPSGLSFEPSTRIISGTPTIDGTYTITYTANNGTNANSVQFTITVNPPLGRTEFLGTKLFDKSVLNYADVNPDSTEIPEVLISSWAHKINMFVSSKPANQVRFFLSQPEDGIMRIGTFLFKTKTQ